MVVLQIDPMCEGDDAVVDRTISSKTADATVRRVRLEWNGVSGCRQIEVCRRLIATQGERAVEREERVVGEVSEPFS